MSYKMPKRLEADQLEWNLRKEDILKLYVEQNEPLPEVMRAMAKQGFTRTKQQYERSFKIWRVSKNVRKSEWDFILSRLDERKRPTNVKVRSVAISQTRIELQRLRHRETTLGRCMSQFHPQPRSATPDDIEISSPAPESNIEDHRLGERRDHELELREPNTEFSGNFVESLGTLERDPSLQPVSESVASAVPTTISESGIEHGVSTLAVASTGHSAKPSTRPSFRPRPLYEYIRQFVIDKTEKDYSMRFYQFSFDDDFSLVGHPILDFFVEYAMPQYSLQRIARDVDNTYELALLQSLLLSTQYRARWVHFSLSLLYAAAVNGNIRLLDVVSMTGIDLDARLPLEYRHDLRGKRVLVHTIPGELTPLQMAVVCRRKAIVEALSELNATILTGNRDCDWRFLQDAYEQRDLLQPLLSRLAASQSATARRGIRLLDLAVRRADFKMIDILLKAGFSPYLSLRDGNLDFSGITTFEQVSRRVETPFMAALDMYREEFLRLDKDPMSEIRSSMITNLLSFSHHNLVHEQRLSQLQHVALAYAFAVLTNKHEIRHTLIEETGIEEWIVMTTVEERGWNTIEKVGPIPSPWVAPEIGKPTQDRLDPWPQILL